MLIALRSLLEPSQAGVTGALSLTTPDPTAALAGSVTVGGGLAATLPDPSMTMLGAIQAQGSISTATPDPSFSAAGSIVSGSAGTMDLSTPGPSFEAAGLSLQQSGGYGTIHPLQVKHSPVWVKGRAALEAPTFHAQGEVITPVLPIVGWLASSLDAPTVTATGEIRAEEPWAFSLEGFTDAEAETISMLAPLLAADGYDKEEALLLAMALSRMMDAA